MKILIKNGNVVDVYKNSIEVRDIYIKDGIISEPFEDIDEVLDASGKFVIPGLLDMHVHLREPGREDEETIETGTKAALHGGITGVACMPNTNPPIDSPELIKFLMDKAAESGHSYIFPIGAITKGQKGEELTEMFLMKQSGAYAFSDDGFWVQNSDVMRKALEYSLMLNVPIISHCEDKNLADGGDINESLLSFRLGLKGIPSQSETIAVWRDVALASLTGARLHIAHVSSEESLNIIKSAKEKGINVTSEVTVHHLYFSEDVLENYDTVFKVNPPLRTRKDRESLINAVINGDVEAIVTDHAPHSIEEKKSEFSRAPFGMIGLETAFYVLYELFILSGKLSLIDLVKKMTINPASILGIKNWGRMERGDIANLFIFDEKNTFKYEENQQFSLSSNSPFLNKEFKGKIESVILRDKKVDF